MNDTSTFDKMVGIGEQGEQLTKQHLEGREYWGTSNQVRNIINPEQRICEAQIWESKAHEHRPNKDYIVTAGACDECPVSDCQYKVSKPYESKISECHEVKTNVATHMQKIVFYGDPKKKEREYNPSLNLFIEYWQDVSYQDKQKIEAGKPIAEDRKGWFQQDPPAWYHFYQPIRYKNAKGKLIDGTEKESITKDHPIAKQFINEMTTSDRLILRIPWGYILSITGQNLHEIEPSICAKNLDGSPKLVSTQNIENEKWSMGTLIPVIELLNNPKYYNREGISKIAFTPLFNMVRGKIPKPSSEPTYYLPAHIYNLIFRHNPDKTGQRITCKTMAEALACLRAIFITSPSFTAEIILKQGAPYTKLKNGWAVLLPDGRINVTATTLLNNEPYEHYVTQSDIDAGLLIFDLTGDQTRVLGETYLNGTMGEEIVDGISQKTGEVEYTQAHLIPNLILLKQVKSYQSD